MASYYRKFIRDFATTASPLYTASIEKKLVWNEECALAFDRLRRHLTDTESVLLLPEFEKPFKLETDASNFGIGGILSQNPKNDSVWQPNGYYAKHLSKAERNYSASERELLAVVKSIEHFKQFLYGQRFTVVTDHQPLQWLMTVKNPAARLARWITRLEQYDFKIEYRKGSLHQNADALSRWPLEDPNDHGENDNNDILINHIEVQDDEHVYIIKPTRKRKDDQEWIELNIQAIQTRPIEEHDAQNSDSDIQWVKALLKENESKPVVPVSELNPERKCYLNCWNDLFLSDELLWRKVDDGLGNQSAQYIVPVNKRPLLMEQLHTSIYSGHLRFDKMIDRARKSFFWPKQQRTIKNFLNECIPCQKALEPRVKAKAKLCPIRVFKTLELVTSDVLRAGKTSRSGNQYILVIIDHFTKFIQLYALRNQEAHTIAQCFQNFIMKFGIPEAFLSDQGKNFRSLLITQLWELLDVKQKQTSSYHPETDGLSERLNRSVIKMIKCYINENHTDWDEHLDELSFAYNTARHATTKYSPFFLMFGRHPKVPAEIFIKDPKITLPLTPGEFASQMEKCLKTAYFCVKRNTELKMIYNKEYHDRKNIAAEFTVGHRVWVRELKTPKGLCRKFNSKWKGPYTVEAIVNEVDYRVKPDNRGKKLLVHRNNLKSCMEPLSEFTEKAASQVEVVKVKVPKPKHQFRTKNFILPATNPDHKAGTNKTNEPIIRKRGRPKKPLKPTKKRGRPRKQPNTVKPMVNRVKPVKNLATPGPEPLISTNVRPRRACTLRVPKAQ